MDDKQVFAQNLKVLRAKMGILQRDAARRLQIQPTAFLAYERGEKLPTVKNLIKIADFFDVSADKLLGRERRSVKNDILTEAKSLLNDYGFNWDTKSKCFWSTDGNVTAIIGEYQLLLELVKDGYIKADVLELVKHGYMKEDVLRLWLEDKRKKMEKGTLAKMP